MSRFLVLFTLVISTFSYGSISDCQNVYIGRVLVEKGSGLHSVVYLNGPSDSSGSYWSTFVGWSAEEKKDALSVLLTAKAAQLAVNVVTESSDSCGIQTGPTVTKSLYLTKGS